MYLLFMIALCKCAHRRKKVGGKGPKCGSFYVVNMVWQPYWFFYNFMLIKVALGYKKPSLKWSTIYETTFAYDAHNA